MPPSSILIKNIYTKFILKCIVPGNFVTAGHGEQPFTLKNPIPSLDGVTGANWDGAFPRLDFGAELPTSFPVRVPVSLI